MALVFAGFCYLLACTVPGDGPTPAQSQSPLSACGKEDFTLNLGFYAYFPPVSYSENEDPASSQFNIHRGYEADLLSAVELMENPKVAFSRRAITPWEGIWLQSATPDYDLVGGGITILNERTRDAGGNPVVTFTDGHITFRQSLLVRAEDTEILASYSDLTQEVRVGVMAGTTGEHRLLELTGLVNDKGALADGTRITIPEGTLVADGSGNYSITAARESPKLHGRSHLSPPSEDQPQVVYLGAETGDRELLEALQAGQIDAFARGEIGNRQATRNSGGGNLLVVTALDDRIEQGGFTVAADRGDLLACLNQRINWLTDNRNIGYAQWLGNPLVFEKRAETWNQR